MSSGERARGVNYEFQQKVIEMGFDRAVVERVIARHVQEKGSPYTDLTDLIEDLVAEDARLESTKSPDNSAYGHGRTHSKEQKQLDKELDDSRMPSILSAFHDLQRELNKIHPEEKVTSSNTGLLTASSSQPLQTTRQHKPTSQYQLKPPHSGGKLTTTAPTKNLIPAGSKDARLCKICLDREIAVVFLECAHVVSCEECASKLFECPICRAPIRAKVRAFFA
jgi:baculoviral IAP repeat-containing protein 2/3